MPKEVVLIRHGETDWNAEQRWQGHSDIPLNSKGRAQAERLANDLRPLSLQVLLSSDLARALETAQVLADQLRIPLFKTSELREVNVGRAEGMGYQEAISLFGPEVLQRWRSIYPVDLKFAFPGGETKQEAVDRALKVLKHFIDTVEVDRIGVVTHGMLIRTCIHYLFPKLESPLVVPNCAYYSLGYDAFTQEWAFYSEIEERIGKEPWEESKMPRLAQSEQTR